MPMEFNQLCRGKHLGVWAYPKGSAGLGRETFKEGHSFILARDPGALNRCV